MTNICLVRHGQTDWNKEFKIQGRYNVPLNATGKEQILKTAIKIKNLDIKWDVFYSSPLDRAIETCSIIKNHLGYSNNEIIIEDDLIEREFGVADGLHINDEVYDKILIDGYAGMEKASEIQERAYNVIIKIAKAHPNKNILIATHSHLIKALFTKLDNNLTFKSLLNNGSLNFVNFEDDKIINFEFNK